jgi:uncharacterized protein
VFGWDYDVSGPEFGFYATVNTNGQVSAGIGGQMPGAPPSPAAWSLYFASDDLAADLARAEALGAKALYPPMEIGTFGAMVTLLDPAGAEFSFWRSGTHIGAKVTGEHGSMSWNELYTSDAGKARDFYCALLGATAQLMPVGMEYYVLMRGAEQLGGVMQINPDWGTMPSRWVTYFAVDNTDAVAARITANGGQIMGAIDDSPFGRVAAAADPAGAWFKIIQPPSG